MATRFGLVKEFSQNNNKVLGKGILNKIHGFRKQIKRHGMDDDEETKYMMQIGDPLDPIVTGDIEPLALDSIALGDQ